MTERQIFDSAAPRRPASPSAGGRVPELADLESWVAASGDHAEHRLGLLRAAGAPLRRPPVEDVARRHGVAERLERWRYQFLAARWHATPPGTLTVPPAERRFLAALARTADRLEGRSPGPARWPRAALADERDPSGRVAAAAAALDSAVPVARLEREAAAATRAAHLAPDSSHRRAVRLYAPIYLSNECVNDCPYCGFGFSRKIARRRLSMGEIEEQASVLRSRGFRHVVLVAGEFPARVDETFLTRAIRCLVSSGMHPAIEVAPQSTRTYAVLAAAGATGVTLYMETYDESNYARHHRRGPKAAYDWRLEGIERAAEAGMQHLGLGVLLGLSDPRDDLLALVRHAAYLLARFPDRELAFSLPRIHDAPAGFSIEFPVSDEFLIRAYAALRLAFPQAGLVLSTRESVALRNRLVPVCITQMSAGSSTRPGGYGPDTTPAGEQFATGDQRSPEEISRWLDRAGLRPAWEWDRRTA
ncbi:MAG: radical SAM protein [Acidobacteriota bacterium]